MRDNLTTRLNIGAVSSAMTGRQPGSIEYKHQNISAVLMGLGETWITGYNALAGQQF